jgi:hypothetical protein
LQRRCGRRRLIGLPKPIVFLVRCDAISQFACAMADPQRDVSDC